MVHKVVNIKQWLEKSSRKGDDSSTKTTSNIRWVAEELSESVEYLSNKYGPGETVAGFLDIAYVMMRQSCLDKASAPQKMRELLEHTINIFESTEVKNKYPRDITDSDKLNE